MVGILNPDVLRFLFLVEQSNINTNADVEMAEAEADTLANTEVPFLAGKTVGTIHTGEGLQHQVVVQIDVIT